MLHEYKFYIEKEIETVEIPLIDDCLHKRAIHRIVGYCHCPLHKGYLDIELLKQHECRKKECSCLQKFEDYPFWINIRSKKERKEKIKRKQQHQNNMNTHFKRRYENVRRIAQNAIDVRGLPLIVTSVALQKPNKYILNYVSNESRDDSDEYGKLIDKLNQIGIGKFYLKHIKNINGHYATIAEYKSVKR